MAKTLFDGTTHALVEPDGSGGHSPYVALPSEAVVLQASKTITAAGSANETAVTDLGGYRQAMLLLDLTDAKAAVGDTLDVYVDTSPDGTTWVNVCHFTQILGNGADTQQYWAVLDPGGAPGTDTIAVGTDCAAGKVRPSMLCDCLRVRHVVVDGGAHGQSFTFAVKAFIK